MKGITMLSTALILLLSAPLLYPARTTRGSCNVIQKGSVCIEYTGSYWTAQSMSKHCQGNESVYTTGPCPAASRLGGCLQAPGKEYENILWYFSAGGSPIEPENLEGLVMSCRLAGGKWLNP